MLPFLTSLAMIYSGFEKTILKKIAIKKRYNVES